MRRRHLAGALLTGQALGVLLAITGGVVYAIYIILGSDVMKRVSPVQSVAVIFTTAALGNGVLMLVTGPHLPATGKGWGASAGLVVITTLLPVVAFLAGLARKHPAARRRLLRRATLGLVCRLSWNPPDQL
jgi:drug/metabolite transporter (DMT)-like permease